MGSEGPLEITVALSSVEPEAVEVQLRVNGLPDQHRRLTLTACFAFLDIGDRCLKPIHAASDRSTWEAQLITDLPDEPVAVGVHIALDPGTDSNADPNASPSANSEQSLSGSGASDAQSDLLLTLHRPEIFDSRPPPPGSLSRDPNRSARVIRVVSPPNSGLKGTQRFRILVSDPRVTKVAFQLDGEQVSSDGAPPFSARINLGNQVNPHSVEAIAYDLHDNEIGRDQVEVNRRRIRNRVRLSGTELSPGSLRVDAEITVRPDVSIDRVQIIFRGQTVADRNQPPYSALIDASDPDPTDYVQVIATLSNGTTIEDVLLLGDGTMGEQIEVHLTELFAVATDTDGKIIEDLAVDSLRLSVNGNSQAIQRFARAEELPLTVGLVIDTSGSMYALIPDTQQAAGRFLSGVLRPKDRAFIVDFDTRPRLAHEASEDRRSLINRLAVLRAEGFTALFDSIIYSTLEFPIDGRRRALVVLTDGDDYKSKLGPDNAIEHALAAGAPVYIISLAGIHQAQQAPNIPAKKIKVAEKPDIERVAEFTGGRVSYLTNKDQLQATYDQILRELTHQYLVTFTTPQELTEQERDSIQLNPTTNDVKLRFTVGRPAEDG